MYFWEEQENNGHKVAGHTCGSCVLDDGDARDVTVFSGINKPEIEVNANRLSLLLIESSN